MPPDIIVRKIWFWWSWKKETVKHVTQVIQFQDSLNNNISWINGWSILSFCMLTCIQKGKELRLIFWIVLVRHDSLLVILQDSLLGNISWIKHSCSLCFWMNINNQLRKTKMSLDMPKKERSSWICVARDT